LTARASDDPRDLPIPDAFARRMAALLDEPAARAVLEALSAEPRRAVRANPRRTTLEEVARLTGWTLHELPWSPEAGLLSEPEVTRPGNHPLHAAGAFYLQDPTATAAAAALAVTPGEWVADLAAAPGGKATALGARLEGQGVLLANDVHRSRVEVLARNLERFGIRNAIVTQADPSELADRLPGRFDAVLLDAPCSGEAMFQKSLDARRDWSLDLVRRNAQRQGPLLDTAADLLKAGGRLVYATCTFSPEENEGVVGETLLRRADLHAAASPLRFVAPGHASAVGVEEVLPDEAVARLWPHHAPGAGHVVTNLERVDAPPREVRRRGKKRQDLAFKPPPRATLEAWRAFRAAALTGVDTDLENEDTLRERAGVLWRVADLDLLDALSGVTVLRPGLALGRVQRDRFEPAHALAMALDPSATHSVVELSLDGPSLPRWLVGEELDVEERDVTWSGDGSAGYALLVTAGMPLGWTRRSGTRLRNLYPKGLRQR